LPGGFVDYGESLETAAVREALEETSLQIQLVEQFYAYSNPQRDPRQHTLSMVFIATATGEPQAQDDAKSFGIFTLANMPTHLCFDHDRILADYGRYRRDGCRPQIG
jgi:8-oxo-dGTP diphosphatase